MEELNLGKKLQAIRTSKKISVRKLAAMTNLTASMISQIENGADNPSIPTLRTISSALETPIYYFFKDEDNASVVVTQSTRMVLGNKQEPSVVYDLLTPDDMVVMDLEGNRVEGTLNPARKSSSS